MLSRSRRFHSSRVRIVGDSAGRAFTGAESFAPPSEVRNATDFLRQNHGALDGILEFADVAGQSCHELSGVSFGEARRRAVHLPGSHADEVRSELGDVLAAFAQRRNFDGKNAQAIE